MSSQGRVCEEQRQQGEFDKSHRDLSTGGRKSESKIVQKRVAGCSKGWGWGWKHCPASSTP